MVWKDYNVDLDNFTKFTEYFIKPECSAIKEKCFASYLLLGYLQLNFKKITKVDILQVC